MPYFEVKDDYTPLLTESAEYLIDDSLVSIQTFCKGNRGFGKISEPKTKIVFTENPYLELDFDTPHYVYFIYGGKSKKKWRIKNLQQWTSPYTKNYLIEYLRNEYKLDFSAANYFYNLTGGRYATLSSWLNAIKPGVTRTALIDQFEPQGSCNVVTLIDQILNDNPLTELANLDSNLDAHKGFNYLIVAFPTRPVGSIANLVWNLSKETDTTKVDFIIYANWLRYCVKRRKKSNTVVKNLANLVPNIDELLLLKDILDK